MAMSRRCPSGTSPSVPALSHVSPTGVPEMSRLPDPTRPDPTNKDQERRLFQLTRLRRSARRLEALRAEVVA